MHWDHRTGLSLLPSCYTTQNLCFWDVLQMKVSRCRVLYRCLASRVFSIKDMRNGYAKELRMVPCLYAFHASLSKVVFSFNLFDRLHSMMYLFADLQWEWDLCLSWIKERCLLSLSLFMKGGRWNRALKWHIQCHIPLHFNIKGVGSAMVR